MPVEIATPADLAAVRELWDEYWNSCGFAPEFQGFQDELRGLPGKYCSPGGCLLIARVFGEPAATGAFRPLRPGACEAKRLYVRPAFRRRGLARALIARLVDEARRAGYRELFGDTLATMRTALDLYRSLGFAEVEPYSETPTPGAVYLRLAL